MQKTFSTSETVKIKTVIIGDTTYEYELRRLDGSACASFEIVLYEICVRMICGENVSFYKTGAIFSNVDKASGFLSFLYDNLATPQNTPYVLEDAISF